MKKRRFPRVSQCPSSSFCMRERKKGRWGNRGLLLGGQKHFARDEIAENSLDSHVVSRLSFRRWTRKKVPFSDAHECTYYSLIFPCTSSRIEIFSMDELYMFLPALFLVSIKNLSELHGGINYPPVEKVTQRQEKGKYNGKCSGHSQPASGQLADGVKKKKK